MLQQSLNDAEIKIHSQTITKIKPFIDKYNWEVISYPSEKDDWKKNLRKIIQCLLLMFCMLKTKNIYILPIFQNINQVFLLMIPNKKDDIILQ